MEKDTIRNYLKRSEFSDVQAEALADILSDQATKADIRELRGDFRELRSDFRRLEQRLDAAAQTTESKLTSIENLVDKKLSAMEARLTWRMIAAVTFLGTVMTLVGAFLN